MLGIVLSSFLFILGTIVALHINIINKEISHIKEKWVDTFGYFNNKILPLYIKRNRYILIMIIFYFFWTLSTLYLIFGVKH